MGFLLIYSDSFVSSCWTAYASLQRLSRRFLRAWHMTLDWTYDDKSSTPWANYRLLLRFRLQTFQAQLIVLPASEATFFLDSRISTRNRSFWRLAPARVEALLYMFIFILSSESQLKSLRLLLISNFISILSFKY